MLEDDPGQRPRKIEFLLGQPSLKGDISVMCSRKFCNHENLTLNITDNIRSMARYRSKKFTCTLLLLRIPKVLIRKLCSKHICNIPGAITNNRQAKSRWIATINERSKFSSFWHHYCRDHDRYTECFRDRHILL